MRVFTAILFTLAFLFANVSPAQNIKRTKHYKKVKKKKSKKLEENVGFMRRQRDDDGDGVPNYYDHCPNTPAGQEVHTFGCPPDRDKDGIPDLEDKCPDEWGTKSRQGCPPLDSDGDGIIDEEDKCPQVKGEPRFGGCPDTDKDGIADEFDKCPDVKGPREYQGCPQVLEANADSDNDGIPDFKDACPNEAGVPENKGCPEMSEADKAAILAAFKNLLFETNSDVIDPSSYASLNKLADVLDHNKGAKLRLEGHTDNVGNDAANLNLSDRRAKAVKLFLVNKGVEGFRISATGYGETRPVTSNDTPEGRTQNRRVEMHIDY